MVTFAADFGALSRTRVKFGVVTLVGGGRGTWRAPSVDLSNGPLPRCFPPLSTLEYLEEEAMELGI